MLDFISKLPQIIVEWIRPNIEQYLKTRQPLIWLTSLLVGLAVAVAAIIFREAIALIQWTWLGTTSERIAHIVAQHPWQVILLAPAIGGLVVGVLLEKITPLRRASGVADVIEARALGGRYISMKQAAASALVTVISLGAGASAGREGPVVHLGAALSAKVNDWFRLPDWGRRTMLACGVASAISASFNAPIAGVLFAHEVILGHYAMRAFVPIVISAATSGVISRIWFGDNAAFIVPHYLISSYWEFPAFALLGLVCALVSVLFQFSLMSTDFIARKIEMPLFLRPAIGGLAVGAIALVFPQVLGVGYEATDMALSNHFSIGLMLGLIVAKTAATAITLASRFGGGIFSPTIYLGAMTGGSFGLIAASLFPDLASSQGLYAIIGMGAVTAAVLGAPISTTMIVFELTGGYALSIALLLAVSISNGINNAIHGHSFFQWQLEMRGIFINEGQHRHVVRTTPVAEFMEPLDEEEEVPIIGPDHHPNFLLPSQNLETALRAFDAHGLAYLPVVDENDHEKPIGWASQIRALSYFNAALVDATEEEHQH